MGQPAGVAAVLLLIVGTIFIGQGTGFLRSSSFMVGDSRWAWIGAVMVIAGLVLGAITLLRDRA